MALHDPHMFHLLMLLRVGMVKAVFVIATAACFAVVRLLPRNHPTRIYLVGRMDSEKAEYRAAITFAAEAERV